MLEFSISNQLLSRLDATKVMADSENYLECAFQFSADWKDTVAVATFGHNKVDEPISVRIVDGKCRVPHEVIKTYGFQLSVYGTVEKDEGTACHIPTNVVTVEVEASGGGQGLTPAEPTKNLYDTLMTAIAEGEAAAVAAKVSAQGNAEVAVAAAQSAAASAENSTTEARNAEAAREALKSIREQMEALVEQCKSYVLGDNEVENHVIENIEWDADNQYRTGQLMLRPGGRYRVKVDGVWWDVPAQWTLEQTEIILDPGQADLFGEETASLGRARPDDEDATPEIPGGDEVVEVPGGDEVTEEPTPEVPGGDEVIEEPTPEVPGGDETDPVTPTPTPTPTPVRKYVLERDIVKLVAGPVTIEDVALERGKADTGKCRITTTDTTVARVEIQSDGARNAKYYYEQAEAAARRAEAAAQQAQG